MPPGQLPSQSPDPDRVPPRPAPARRPLVAIGEWVAWVGIGRIVAGAVSIALVGAGGYWLLRAPTPPVEAGLPVATAAALEPPTASTGVPTTTEPGPTHVVVHVAGAVAAPGVYTLSTAARVADAVASAGGSTADATVDALNLAAPLTDGQRIYVPTIGELDPAEVAVGIAEPVPTGSAVGGRSEPIGPLDVNRATAAELETLPGVGPATAAAIVDDRGRNGPFVSVDEIERVPGIGPAKLAALRDLVTV